MFSKCLMRSVKLCAVDHATRQAQFVRASIRTKLSWTKICYKLKNSNKNKNKKMNKSRCATRRFPTLEESTTHAGGIATFDKARGPQVILYKC